jgi:hypothetical protein
MSDYNVRFTMDMVERDSRLFSDWYVLRQIERDYYSILEEALRSTNREIIRHAIDFPLDIVYISDEFRDHLAFRRFARFFPEIYEASARLIEDESLKEFVYDRIWRSLQDYINFRIMSKLEDSNISNEDIATYGGYAIEIALIFNTLLKMTIDLKDLNQFKTYGRAFNEMMKWLGENPSNRVTDLEHYLQFTTDVKLRNEYEVELAKKKNIANVEEDFNQKRQLIWLGIGGWLVHLVSSNRLLPESYKEWADVVAIAFPDLEILYKTYLIDHNNRYIISRDWTSWELQEAEEKEKGTFVVGGLIKNDSWITKYYCQHGIELSQININSIPKIIPCINQRDILDEVSNVAETFRASEMWKKTFNFSADQLDDRINSFIQIHRNISEFLKEIEDEAVIEAPIDPGLISDFKSKVISSWDKTSNLRNLMKKFGKYEERPEAHIPDNFEAFGLDRLDPKAVFIKQNKTHFIDWGEGLGRALGTNEDARLIKLIMNSLPMVKTNLDRLDDTIYHNLNSLRANGSNPILLYNRVHIHGINKSKYYKPAWKVDIHELKDIEGFNGTFDGAAIINIGEHCTQNILLVDFCYFAKLVQYRFDKGSEYPLSITIEPMDEKKADKLLTNQPDLLIDKDSGEKIEREKAIRNLLQKVHLQIWQKFRLEDIDPIRGLRIELEE